MAARSERRSFWTWGYVSDEPSDAARKQAAKTLSGRLGALVEPPPVPAIEDIEIREPRLGVPVAVADWVSTSAMERITHTHGGHALELLKGLRGQFDNPPDAIAHPRTEDELDATLAWCDQAGHVAIPYGGGTSVVWGVTVPVDAATAVTIDLDNLNTLLEVDEVSRAARVQGGMLGPDLEAALKPRGLTLRHFPQSFPWSTVGGWVATRSGGHYATNHTHIDDFVESTRMLTPRGWLESRRLPGSGAGPSPDRLVLGSEGILGIVSECWLRLQKRPDVPGHRGRPVPVVAAGLRGGPRDCPSETLAGEPAHSRSGGGGLFGWLGWYAGAADYRLRVERIAPGRQREGCRGDR